MYVRQMVRETRQIGFGPAFCSKVRAFQNYQLCLLQLNMVQVMWRMPKYIYL